MWIFSAIANAVGRNFIGSANYLYDLIFNRAKDDGGVTEAQQCTIDQISYIDKVGLISQASLLVTPTSYKEGKLYADLPTNGNGDFTATRATTATRVNSAGLVDLVPYNLLQQSEMFSQAIWTKSATTLTANTTTAPDGTLTADTLIENTANSSHQVFQSVTSVNGATAYTATIYVKQNTNRNVALRIQDGAFTYGQAIVTYNLNTGALISQTVSGNGAIVSTSATLVNGYYRIQLTFTINLSTSFRTDILIVNGSSNSYLGDGTSNIIIWGAQLVEGTSARDYLRTETRLNIPRIDYSLGGCPNILLEPQRTNLALQSSSFESASWIRVASSGTANTTTSPSGIQDADTFTANGANSDHTIYQLLTTTSGTAYTFSSYVKANTGRYILVRITTNGTSLRYGITFDLQTGTITQTSATAVPPSNVSNSITNVGNGWYRISLTLTASGTSSGMVISTSNTATPTLNANLDYSYIGTESYFLWGAQLEVGAYATSYIPTTTASVTRNADSITRNNIYTNGLITAAGGTWFVELRNNALIQRDAATQGIFINTGTSATIGNGITIRNLGGSVRNSIVKIISGTATTIYTTTSNTCKIAIKWNGTTADVFENGVKVVSATSFTPTAMQNLIGDGSALTLNINEMALFPTPLTDAQMSMLTSGIYPTAAAAYASLGLVSESPSCLTSTTTF